MTAAEMSWFMYLPLTFSSVHKRFMISRFLVHELAALVERNAASVELALVPAGRYAHDQAPFRKLVHAGELLGERDGIAQRQNENAGAELDALRAGGDAGQHRQRVDDREIWLDAEQHMIPHPDRIVAELLDPDAVFDQLLCVGHLRIGGEIARGDAERLGEALHAACPPEDLPQAVNRRSGSSILSVSSSWPRAVR